MPHNHLIDISGAEITTDRIRLRPWTEADAEPALAVFGAEAVARWLAPAMSSIPDVDAMRGSCGGGPASTRTAVGRPGAGRWSAPTPAG